MKLKDIKTGMKVKLLGKHAVNDYDNIEDWFKDNEGCVSVEQIKEQGFGYVTDIHGDGMILVADNISNDGWFFLPSDLEPYDKEFFKESQEEKSPKEWLLTTKAIYTLRNNIECITLGDGKSYRIDKPMLWNYSLNIDYDEDLNFGTPYNIIKELDVMKIEYQGKTVWERKEYMTLTDAIKTGKKIKHKDWNKYYTISELLRLIRLKRNSDLINDFTVAEWEVE